MPLALQSSWLLTCCLFSLGYEQGVLQSMCSKPQAQARLGSDSGCLATGSRVLRKARGNLETPKVVQETPSPSLTQFPPRPLNRRAGAWSPASQAITERTAPRKTKSGALGSVFPSTPQGFSRFRNLSTSSREPSLSLCRLPHSWTCAPPMSLKETTPPPPPVFCWTQCLVTRQWGKASAAQTWVSRTPPLGGTHIPRAAARLGHRLAGLA